jgi:hypothetical protein
MGIFDIFKGLGNKNIKLFPEIEDVFGSDLEKCRAVFFPICSIPLSEINKEWGDGPIHLVQFNEDPYNEDAAKYHNEYCKYNMIAFDLRNGKYSFKADFGYFDLSGDWQEWFNKTRESYQASKAQYLKEGETFGIDGLQLGGEPEWWQADETPLDPDGEPMHFITEYETDTICDDSCDKKIFLFYSPKHKLAVQIYQIT